VTYQHCTPALQDAIVAAYQSGISATSIAFQHGIGRMTVYRIMRDKGIDADQQAAARGTKDLAIIADYKAGMAPKDIARKHGVHISRVHNTRRRRGIPARTPPAIPNIARTTGRQILEAVCRAWLIMPYDIIDSQNRGQREAMPRRQAAMAALRMGYTPKAVSRWLKRHHTAIHHARREHDVVVSAAHNGKAASRHVSFDVCITYWAKWLSVADTLGIPA